MLSIFVYTFSMGRWRYLERCVESVAKARLCYGGRVTHVVFLQGVDLPSEYERLKEVARIFKFPANIGIARGINVAMAMVKEELIIKLDDDCALLGEGFFRGVNSVANDDPALIFSPYPVGLIGNPGGTSAIGYGVFKCPTEELFYTLRYVNHVGGLCRVSPNLTKNWVLKDDLNLEGVSGNEDLQFSLMARSHGLKMAYLENGLVVEHQESTLGQHARYGKAYFKDRF